MGVDQCLWSWDGQIFRAVSRQQTGLPIIKIKNYLPVVKLYFLMMIKFYVMFRKG